MTEQIKPEQFIWSLLSKSNNKTKSNCPLWSKTDNQNQFKMMTNNSRTPLTTVPTDSHPDVSVSTYIQQSYQFHTSWIDSDI